MSEVRFGVTDLANVRFAVSPLWETVASYRVLADPGGHALHLPWIKAARRWEQQRELAERIAPLRDLLGRDGALPAFLTPPPNCPLAEIEQEIAIMRATPAARIRADLRGADPAVRQSPFGRFVREDPERALPRLADAVLGWWQAAVSPYWPRIRALLEADIAYRSRQLAEDGIRQLLDSLHPGLRWAGDRLVADRHDVEVDLRGRGLPLTPSVFIAGYRFLTGHSTAPARVGVIYPARAVGTLWERRGADGNGLARLLGRSRAQLFAYTGSPVTTTHLAARTGLSAGAVSQHLAVLRAAGLVTSSRYRREVHYTASDLGMALLGRP